MYYYYSLVITVTRTPLSAGADDAHAPIWHLPPARHGPFAVLGVQEGQINAIQYPHPRSCGPVSCECSDTMSLLSRNKSFLARLPRLATLHQRPRLRYADARLDIPLPGLTHSALPGSHHIRRPSLVRRVQGYQGLSPDQVAHDRCVLPIVRRLGKNTIHTVEEERCSPPWCTSYPTDSRQASRKPRYPLSIGVWARAESLHR